MTVKPVTMNSPLTLHCVYMHTGSQVSLPATSNGLRINAKCMIEFLLSIHPPRGSSLPKDHQEARSAVPWR